MIGAYRNDELRQLVGAMCDGTITADVPVRADFSAHVSADYIGAAICLVGVAIIMYAPRH
jgi:hypothetical protein